MKNLIILLVLAALLFGCGRDKPKVLMYITDGSRDLELMITKEVLVMKEILEKADFKVVIATSTGENILLDSAIIKPDMELESVDIGDYSGFIFPCMAPPWEKIYNLDSAVVAFVGEVAKTGRPMAAQTLSVADFAQAGLLIDKKYAFTIDPDLEEYPDFKDGIYSGEGVIRDGNVITSGTCPWKTREYGKPDGTTELTRILIDAIQEDF